MRTPSLAVLGCLIVFSGCTSESTPPVIPGEPAVTEVAKNPTTQAPAAAKATTATWIVYEMPG